MSRYLVKFLSGLDVEYPLGLEPWLDPRKKMFEVPSAYQDRPMQYARELAALRLLPGIAGKASVNLYEWVQVEGNLRGKSVIKSSLRFLYAFQNGEGGVVRESASEIQLEALNPHV